MQDKQVLRTLLKHTVEGNIETNVFERIEQEVLTEQELTELLDNFGDDPETAYLTYGMCFDMNDDLSVIMLDHLACGLEDFLKSQEDDEKNVVLEGIAKKIEPLRKYNLDFEAKPEK